MFGACFGKHALCNNHTKLIGELSNIYIIATDRQSYNELRRGETQILTKLSRNTWLVDGSKT